MYHISTKKNIWSYYASRSSSWIISRNTYPIIKGTYAVKLQITWVKILRFGPSSQVDNKRDTGCPSNYFRDFCIYKYYKSSVALELHSVKLSTYLLKLRVFLKKLILKVKLKIPRECNFHWKVIFSTFKVPKLRAKLGQISGICSFVVYH